LKPYAASGSKSGQAKKQSANEARAKLYLRTKLAWLSGYPCGENKWLSISSDRNPINPLIIDSKLISSTQYALNKVILDFPRALPRIINNIPRWQAETKKLLELVKLNILNSSDKNISNLLDTDYTPYSKSACQLARSIIKNNKSLLPLIKSYSWFFYLDSEQLGKILLWTQENKIEICNIIKLNDQQTSHKIILNLWILGKLSNIKQTKSILFLLSNEALYDFPTNNVRHYLERIVSICESANANANLAKEPKPVFIKNLTQWLFELKEQDRNAIKRVLGLFNRFNWAKFANDWTQYWQAIEPIITNAKTSIVTNRKKNKTIQTYPLSLSNTISDALSQLPIEFKSDFLFRISYFSASDNSKHYQVLNLIPINLSSLQKEHYLLFLMTLIYDKETKLISVYLHYCQELKSTFNNKRNVKYAFNYINCNKKHSSITITYGNYYSNQHINIISILKRKSNINQYFNILMSHCQIKTLKHMTEVDFTYLALLCSIISDSKIITTVFEQTKTKLSSDYAIDIKIIVTAIKLCGENHPQLAKLIVRLETDCLESWQQLDNLNLISNYTNKIDLRDEFLEYISVSSNTAIDELAQLCRFCKITTRFVPLAIKPNLKTHTPKWIKEYPIEIQDLLKKFTSLGKHAKLIALKITHKYIPNKKALALEAETINRKLSLLLANSEHSQVKKMTARLNNIEKYINKATSLNANQTKKLVRNLETRLLKIIFEDWHVSLNDKLQAYLNNTYNTNNEFDTKIRSQLVLLLPSLKTLTPAIQQLAHKVIKRRLLDPPWDMREMSANKTFIDALVYKGINMTPWLDGTKTLNFNLDKTPCQLSFENDPLEIFLMGKHFNTCLSPNEFNYFSVFVNAADINKRVLYARSNGGRVIARMLLGLSDQGGLIGFHAYSHLLPSEFEDQAKSFINSLAQEMNTIVLPHASISSLTVKEWYDDGPIDLSEKFSELYQNSFKTKLLSCDLEKVIDVFLEVLKPLEINELTLNIILHLNVFDFRPELILPFLDFTKANQLNIRDLTRVFDLSLLADSIELSYSLLGSQYIQACFSYFNQHNYLYDDSISHLAKIAPSRALKLLRISRYHGVNRWDQEYDFERLEAAINANIILGRKNQSTLLLKTLQKAWPEIDNNYYQNLARRILKL